MISEENKRELLAKIQEAIKKNKTRVKEKIGNKNALTQGEAIEIVQREFGNKIDRGLLIRVAKLLQKVVYGRVMTAKDPKCDEYRVTSCKLQDCSFMTAEQYIEKIKCIKRSEEDGYDETGDREGL